MTLYWPHAEFWPKDHREDAPPFIDPFFVPQHLIHGSLKKSKPPNKQKDESLEIEIQRPEDIPGYHEYQKFVTLLVEGIDYEDFGKNNCDPKFVEMYMMRSGYYNNKPRQKSGTRNNSPFPMDAHWCLI